MNSTFAVLQREIIGLVNLGDGELKFSGNDIKLFLLNENLQSYEIENLFREVAERDALDFQQELEKEDRHALDDVIFDTLELTKGERDGVYEAVIRLVEDRLKKASSLKPEKHGMNKRLEAVERTQGIWQGVPDFEESEDEPNAR